MNSVKSLASAWKNCTPLRFVIVGGWNFLFGYGAFAGLYWAWCGCVPDVVIALVATVAGITMSFLTHRLVTFRSHGPWWREYLKFYVVYGAQSALNVALIWLFVTRAGYNAYVVQLVISVALTFASYWAHKFYSFKSNRP